MLMGKKRNSKKLEQRRAKRRAKYPMQHKGGN